MTVELASAYVSIVPTTKGIQAGLEKELSPLTGVASKAGADSGRALGSSFTGASGGLKSSLGEAEGAFSSFKGKAVGALDSVGISAGVLKVAGAAGVVEFGLKSVEAFTNTAIAARNLGTATGLTVEDASRWIGIAKDMGVNADTLRAGLGKVSKTLDDTKWSAYGIATHDAGGQARSVNDILLDSFDKLGKISNETERARVGNDLFGKGYATLAPLIGGSRDELEKMLGSVEKGQVITGSELKTAEKMHEAEQQLKQAFAEVTLALGEQLAKLSPLLEGFAKGIGLIGKIVDLGTGVGDTSTKYKDFSKLLANTDSVQTTIDALGQLTTVTGNSRSGFDKTKTVVTGFFQALAGGDPRGEDALKNLKTTLGNIAAESPQDATRVAGALGQIIDASKGLVTIQGVSQKSAKDWVDTYGLNRDVLNDIIAQLPKATDGTDQLDAAVRDSTTSLEGYSYAAQDVQRSTEDATVAEDEYKRHAKSMSDDVKRGLDEIQSGWDRLTGDISDDQTWTKVQLDFIDLKTKVDDAWTAAGKGADDAAQKTLEARAAIDAQKLSVIDYGKTVLGLPESRLTNVVALIDQGSLDAAQAALNNLTRNYTVNMNIVAHGGAGYSGSKTFATGGYTPGGPVLVGEEGRELVDLPKGSYVHTASDTRSLMAGASTSSWATVAAPSSMRPVVVQLTAGNKLLQEIYLSGKQLEASVS